VDTDVDVEERRAAMLVAVKRYRKRPYIVAGQDVADDLQGVADQDSHVLPDDRVVEATELGNLASVLGLLDRRRNLPERQATRHVLDGELEAHDPLNADGVAVLVLIQLEQLQRATTQLLDISVAIVDTSKLLSSVASSSSSGWNNISPMITSMISVDTTKLISSPSMSM
jgi:hypothetical protein